MAAQGATTKPDGTGLPLRKLIPLRTWWEDRSWRTGVPLAFLTLAVVPYVLLHLVGSGDNIGAAAWAFSLYFGGIWFVAIRALVKPERFSKWRLTGIVLFTASVGVSIAVTLERGLASSTGSLVASTLGVGVPEEFAKALPVFLFVFLAHSKRFSPRTYLYLGAVSGLAFGAVEAVTYSALYSSVLPFGGGTYLTEEIWRLITDPVSHACMAGISCYFMGLAAAHRNKQVPLIGVGLAIAALLHGAYDTTASSWIGVGVTALTIFIFVGYALSGERIADEYNSLVEAQHSESSTTEVNGSQTSIAANHYPVVRTSGHTTTGEYQLLTDDARTQLATNVLAEDGLAMP
jgi:RsiW-degrading membrane proteinase PrsW (M82 family)